MRRPCCTGFLQVGDFSPGALITALVLLAAIAGCGSSSSQPSSPAGSSPTAGGGSYGTSIDKPVPIALRRLPLTNQFHQRVTLASWPRRTVLLVPFLTLCQDICPMTTGNLLQTEQSLHADRAASKVQIVEVTVDPQRDTPARLAAYAKLTHADWQLVTAPPATVARLAKFFGFSYQKVTEDKPAGIDWLTGKALTYDVDHSDNYFVIDPAGTERVVQDAAPSFHGQLNPKLYRFLDPLGRQHLAQPPQPDWTPADALKALAISVGQPLPYRPT